MFSSPRVFSRSAATVLSLGALALLGGIAARPASAQVTITLDNPASTITKSDTDTLTGFISGTVDLGQFVNGNYYNVYYDNLAHLPIDTIDELFDGTHTLSAGLTSDFQAFIDNANSGSDTAARTYTGDLVFYDVNPENVEGVYDTSAGGLLDGAKNPASLAVDGGGNGFDYKTYQVTVISAGSAAPEPGSIAFAVLPFAGMVIARRRRSSAK